MRRTPRTSIVCIVAIAALGACRRGGGSSTAPAAWARGTWTYGEFTDGYAWIEFTPGADGRGAFVEKQYACPTEARCRSAGTYEADATHVTLHSPRWRDRSLRVRTAGNIMEWVENEIVVARLTAVPPSRPSPPPMVWPPPDAVPPAGLACDAMSAAQCALSTRCVLERPAPPGSGEYRCRDAVAPCEGGAAQFGPGNFEADCNARPGCRFEASSCFCPCTVRTRVPGPTPSCNCVCGGGAPPRCVPAR